MSGEWPQHKQKMCFITQHYSLYEYCMPKHRERENTNSYKKSDSQYVMVPKVNLIIYGDVRSNDKDTWLILWPEILDNPVLHFHWMMTCDNVCSSLWNKKNN